MFAKELGLDHDSYLRQPSIIFRGLFEYMWISSTDHFLVSTFVQTIDPLRIGITPVHYVQSGADTVDVKLAGSDQWKTHGFRRDGETLWWTIHGEEISWAFIHENQVPQSARDAIIRGKTKLEKEKQSEGGDGDAKEAV